VLSAERLSLGLTYLVSAGAFLSLWGIADDLSVLFSSLVFLTGILNDLRMHLYLPRAMLSLAGILFSAYFLSGFTLQNPVKPFANVLLLLLAIKSLERKKPRDLYQILLLSLLSVSVTTAFRLDVSFLLFFLYELFLGSVTFIFINLYSNVGDRPLPTGFIVRYAKFAFIFPITVAFFSVPFFLLLPRTHTPLFDVSAGERGALVSGIAGSVEIGKVGDIQQDNTVVMRVWGDLRDKAYWRVSVFDTLVGTEWIRTTTVREKEPEGAVLSRYTVMLEPIYDTLLPMPDYPARLLKVEGLRGTVRRLRGGMYESSRPINKPIRYVVLSAKREPVDPPAPVHLGVPDDVPKSIIELAHKLAEGKASAEEKVMAVREFFRRGFSYTLKLESYEGHPIEHFLFRSRKGNCEYFASSTALLLRIMGVPSRVVGGFKGFLENELGGYYIITNSMAHVWVEAYVGGRWVRVDTTPPYVSPALRDINRLDLIRDALLSFWYENVVGFSAQKQLSLAKSLKPDLLKDVFLLSAGFLSAFAGVYLIALFYARKLRKTPRNLYSALLSRIEKIEGEDLKSLMPEEILSRIRDKPYYVYARYIIGLYQRHRFSAHPVSEKELRKGYEVLRKVH